MAVNLYATQNIAGQIQSNVNKISLTPLSPDNDYILIVFTERNNCNNTKTALFENIGAGCEVSEIDIKTVDPNVETLIGNINFTKTGRYNVDIYYQESNSNLDISLATYSYSTCLELSANSSNCLIEDNIILNNIDGGNSISIYGFNQIIDGGNS
jgi:hypothetical protein